MAHPHWSDSMFFDALVHKAGLNCLIKRTKITIDKTIK